ncbi:MAG: hypothetical protein IIB21_05695, partial [Chloroflexi bacterium]|nr:hypothetical protein [Chloroflexota bacterium]
MSIEERSDANLGVELPGRKGSLILANPVMTASGTFSFGLEEGHGFDVQELGAIVTKTVTLRPRPGSPQPRTVETPSGMLNAIGLQNPGVEAVVRKMAPRWARWRVPVIVSILGASVEEYGRLAARLEHESRGADELHTAAIRTLHLVQEQKRTPYARAVGALNAFDNTVVAWQAKTSRRILDEADASSRELLAANAVDLSRQRLSGHARLAERLLSLSAQLRKQLDASDVEPAAFVVQLQRLHPGESINLANANAFREVHTGKEDDLKDLLRLGGDYIYSAPGPGRYRR